MSRSGLYSCWVMLVFFARLPMPQANRLPLEVLSQNLDDFALFALLECKSNLAMVAPASDATI